MSWRKYYQKKIKKNKNIKKFNKSLWRVKCKNLIKSYNISLKVKISSNSKRNKRKKNFMKNIILF